MTSGTDTQSKSRVSSQHDDHQQTSVSRHKSNSRGGKREGAGRKPGYESTLRKTGHKTKTARVPIHVNVHDLLEGLEMLHSLLIDAESEIQESAARSKHGSPSNRFWKLQWYLDQLRAAFPRSYFEDGKWEGNDDERLTLVIAELQSKAQRLQRFSERREY